MSKIETASIAHVRDLIRRSGAEPLLYSALIGPGVDRVQREAFHESGDLRSLAPPAGRPASIDEDVTTILASNLFDVGWYRRRTGRPASDAGDLVRHYLLEGHRTGVGPNPLFDRAWYVDRYSLEIEGADPFVHYVRKGWRLYCDPHPLFSVRFYFERNPEVLTTGCEPLGHYLAAGDRAHLSPNFYFDPDFYVPQLAERDVVAGNYLLHYMEAGEAAGLRPSRYFDPAWYRARYDVGEESPLYHYLSRLPDRTHSPNDAFDVEHYVRVYTDVREHGMDPYRHFVIFGENEGRQPLPDPESAAPAPIEAAAVAPEVLAPEVLAPEVLAPDVVVPTSIEDDIRAILDSELFNVAWYQVQSGLATSDPVDLVRHYLGDGHVAGLSPHPLFDTSWYRARYGDEIAEANPLLHYLRSGWRQRHDPHPLFSVSFYLDAHRDVLDAGREPLAHYVVSGHREGRSPCEDFDGAYYLQQNADVATNDINPLVHYLEYGAKEGRNPSAVFNTAAYRRTILKGRDENPLIHMRSRSSVDARLFGKEIRLEKHYAMSEGDFRRWTKQLEEFVQPATASADELVRVGAPRTDAGSTTDKTGLRDISIKRAIEESRGIATVSSSIFYLFCAASDELDARFLPSLTAAIKGGDGLGIFDFAFRIEDGWVPVLLPGANVAHVEAIDATFSRFIISSRLLARLTLPRDATAYQVLRAALGYLRAADRLDLFTHTALPVLRAEDLTSALVEARMKATAHAHVGERLRPKGQAERSVSIVICSKDRCRLLSQLIDHLLRFPASLVKEVVVVANPAEDSYARRIHDHYAKKDRVTVIRHVGPYNFSKQSNTGAAHCTGDLLLFLNDDIVPINPHWLETLCEPFLQGNVGVAGPLLLYPNEGAQHAGMYLGYNDCAGHALRHANLPDDEYMFMASAARNVSVVTGAVLLTPRALFEQLNGFDRQLGFQFQDVDYCLRVLNCNHEIVYQPDALLFHMESVSLKETIDNPAVTVRRGKEHQHFMRKWGAAMGHDEFHNPNFDVNDETLRTIVHRTL